MAFLPIEVSSAESIKGRIGSRLCGLRIVFTVALTCCMATPLKAQTSAGQVAPNQSPTVQARAASTSSGTPAIAAPGQKTPGITAPQAGSQVGDIISMLNRIDPYRPTSKLSGTLHVYGSTAMDNMAHAWSDEFKQFHPDVTIEVSAAGSGDAFGQLAKNPSALVMLSRPVKGEELQAIKSGTIKEPMAFVVAREALGVFVHATNPMSSINPEQLRAVFTKQTRDEDLKWKLLGVTGPMAEQPIHLVARSETSGTQAFLREFIFGGMEMRTTEVSHGSNSDVLGALAQDPLGITICGLRAKGFSVRSLPLASNGAVIPNDDAAVLTGHYPLTRSLTLVVDLSQTTPEAKAAQELVNFAMCRTGQLHAIRAGFFPADLQTLQAGISQIKRDRIR